MSKKKNITMYCRRRVLILITTFAIANVLRNLTSLHQPIHSSYSGVNYITQRPADYMSDLNKAKVAPDDIKLIELLRNYYIQPPAIVPYNISLPAMQNPSPGQTQFVDNLLNNTRNGFYVDCGAYDGEYLSNSLFLERFRNWNGILIEPNPEAFESLRRKNRKAYTLNACLSTKPYPASEAFFIGNDPVLAKIVKPSSKISHNGGKYIQVQCFPLYSVLLALNQLHVDYFSLDVEGAELGVLETVPWDKIHIRTFSIEHNKWPGGKQNLKAYMKDKGYDFMTEIKVGFADDSIFIKKRKS